MNRILHHHTSESIPQMQFSSLREFHGIREDQLELRLTTSENISEDLKR